MRFINIAHCNFKDHGVAQVSSTRVIQAFIRVNTMVFPRIFREYGGSNNL